MNKLLISLLSLGSVSIVGTGLSLIYLNEGGRKGEKGKNTGEDQDETEPREEQSQAQDTDDKSKRDNSEGLEDKDQKEDTEGSKSKEDENEDEQK